MQQQAFDLFQALVRAGAHPGEDFSFNFEDETCRLNERSYGLLKQHYPDIQWDEFVGIVQVDPQTAIAAVQDHLGINFVDRIIECIGDRLGELPETYLTCYLQQVLYGVEQKTEIPLYDLVQSHLGMSQRVRLEYWLRGTDPIAPCSEWIGDLVWAAGGAPEDCEVCENEAILTEHGMRLLASVWVGEHNLYEDLADRSSLEDTEGETDAEN